MTKFVLCRPLGGLNDCLNQIALCAKYALREGRILVIDTQFSGLGEQFDEVFQLVDFPLDFRVYGPALLEELQTCSAFPAPVGGRLDSYRVISKPGVLGVFEELSGTRLSFNFRKSYSEDLVVHHNGGGGEHSRYLLPYLTLAAEVRRRVVAELDELPLNYFAIHVRNTDYQTPFASLFHRVQKEVIASGMPVLVASDDRAVISEAKKYFGGRLIEWKLALPDVDGPLHKQELLTADQQRLVNVSTLAEWIALAGADRFFYTRTKGRRGSPKSPVSGFSLLARNLRRTKSPLYGVIPQGKSKNWPLFASKRVVFLGDEYMAAKKAIGFWTRKLRSQAGAIRDRYLL